MCRLTHADSSDIMQGVLSAIKDLSCKVDVLLSAAEQQNAEQAAAAEVVGALVEQLNAQLSTWREASCDESEDNLPAPHNAVVQLLTCNAPAKLLSCLRFLNFESRKAAMHIISSCFKGWGQVANQVSELAESTPSMVQQIVDSCLQEETFFIGGELLRSAARCPELASALLKEVSLLKLLEGCLHQSFEISNEVFGSIRELLMTQKRLAAESLDANFEAFFKLYNLLLQREQEYVIQRQAIKLLGEMLLSPEYQKVMRQYVCTTEFLKIIMNLLKSKSQVLPVDAFHVFKIFVANPDKPQAVAQILHRNSDGLVKVLSSFEGGQVDEHCRGDLQAVVGMLESM